MGGGCYSADRIQQQRREAPRPSEGTSRMIPEINGTPMLDTSALPIENMTRVDRPEEMPGCAEGFTDVEMAATAGDVATSPAMQAAAGIVAVLPPFRYAELP